MTRTVEDEDTADNYTDSLEEEDSEGDLLYVQSDSEGDNENVIV
jgi:hypothetical protein